MDEINGIDQGMRSRTAGEYAQFMGIRYNDLIQIVSRYRVVLDLGNGLAVATKHLKQECPETKIIGIDLHPGNEYPFQLQADLNTLPLKSNSVELGLSIACLGTYYRPDPTTSNPVGEVAESYLKSQLIELHRILKPGARAIIGCFPSPSEPMHSTCLLHTSRNPMYTTSSRMDQLLKNTGFILREVLIGSDRGYITKVFDIDKE